jgi:hypothetical protein
VVSTNVTAAGGEAEQLLVLLGCTAARLASAALLCKVAYNLVAEDDGDDGMIYWSTTGMAHLFDFLLPRGCCFLYSLLPNYNLLVHYGSGLLYHIAVCTLLIQQQ